MTDFSYRNDEFEIDGAILSADIEISLQWSWRDGEPHGFTVYSVDNHSAPRAYAPWIKPAMEAWVTQNQQTLLRAFQNRPELYWDADDDAWQRQIHSTAPSLQSHL